MPIFQLGGLNAPLPVVEHCPREIPEMTHICFLSFLIGANQDIFKGQGFPIKGYTLGFKKKTISESKA